MRIIGTKTGRNPWAFLCGMVISVGLFAGCGEKQSKPAAPELEGAAAAAVASQPPDPVDLKAFAAAFASADAGIKLYADETMAVIRTGQFRDAGEQLQKLARNPKLSSEQVKVVQEVLKQLEALPGGR